MERPAVAQFTCTALQVQLHGKIKLRLHGMKITITWYDNRRSIKLN